jgi:hypothetical protein
MPQLINWGIVREPINWLIIPAMVIIGAWGLRLMTKELAGFPQIGGNPAAPRVNAPGV